MFQHAFPFDPTYGYSKDDLLAITAPQDPPPDFRSFWQATFAENAAGPLNISRQPVQTTDNRYDMFEVRFETWHHLRVGAWLVLPKHRPIRCGAVIGHGYGGRTGPDFVDQDAACLYLCMPGFDLSRSTDIPAEAQRHVLHGIASRDTYILRACVATIWSAVSVLQELYPQTRQHLSYLGGSFGGGLGALALPWDHRIERAFLAVPTFGHHPIRLQCPCNGSGQAVRLYAEKHPQVHDVLQYYDSATAATHVKIPVLAAAALFDPAVPPPGQFAVCNSLAGPKRLFVCSAGHFAHPGQAAEDEALRHMTNEVIWNRQPLPVATAINPPLPSPSQQAGSNSSE